MARNERATWTISRSRAFLVSRYFFSVVVYALSRDSITWTRTHLGTLRVATGAAKPGLGD